MTDVLQTLGLFLMALVLLCQAAMLGWVLRLLNQVMAERDHDANEILALKARLSFRAAPGMPKPADYDPWIPPAKHKDIRA